MLFLVVILSVQIGYKFRSILAQENKDSQKIEAVINSFLKDAINRDIDSAMESISVNYSEEENNNIIDYSKFKSALEQFMSYYANKYVNQSISGLVIRKIDIQDNKANVEIEYDRNGFNIDTLQEYQSKIIRIVTLANEGGVWKITQWKQLQQK